MVNPMNEVQFVPVADIMDARRAVPTQEEHARATRRVWIRCLIGAGCCFATMGGIAGAMLLAGSSTEKVVSVQLMLTYIVLPVYAVGFAAPMLVTSLMKLGLGLDMSREGLNVGKKTAEHIDLLQKELRGILTDVKDIVGPVKELVDDIKKHKAGKVVAFIEKLSTDGSVEKIAGALESIGDRIHRALEKVEKGAVEKMVDKI
jgi:uncharacterized protein YoxC